MIRHNLGENGFTIIELLITITILTMLLFTGSYIYASMSERWNKELGQFDSSASNAKHMEIVQRVLEGIYPLVVRDKQQIPSFFFIGSEKSLLSVSRSGFFSGQYPEIFRLSVIKNEKGLFDVVYQSRSTQFLLLLGTDQNVTFTHTLILFKDLEGAIFKYYGWPDLYSKSASNGSGLPFWLARYSGIDSQLMPEKMELKLFRGGQVLRIPVEFESDAEHWLSPYMAEQ